MFRPNTRRARAAVPRRGTSWSITDEALAAIEEHVASHPPERGGALLSPPGSRVVVGYLPDSRPGEHVSYWHSDGLRDQLAAYLASHPSRRYAGTLHSHPAGYAEPSSQDHAAYASTMAANPALREALFPIVVREARGELSVARRLGDAHLVALPSGTFAGYSALPDGDAVEVRPAPMHVVPLRTDITSACERLTAQLGGPVAAGDTVEVEVEGRHLPAVLVSGPGESRVLVAFPETYPTAPPLLVRPGESLSSPAWCATANGGARLADALRPFVVRSTPGPHDERDATGQNDDGPLARLSYHLPGGVSARYLVIGAGSVGSHAAEMLVRSGVRDLAVVDFDTVEPANLSRTVYESGDVGRRKVEVLRDRLTRIAPNVTVRPIDSDIQSLDLAILDSVDVTVLAADDLAAEFWLGHHLYAHGVPAVSIKMFARGDAGEVIVVDPRSGTPCLHCLLGDAPAGRGDTNYGTGRLVTSPALGPDIVATVARGVKVALALGQEAGPLADWVAPLLAENRTYFQHSNVPDWAYIRAFHNGAPSRPFDSMWVAGTSDPACAVCGESREAPLPYGGSIEMPTDLPPGVPASVT